MQSSTPIKSSISTFYPIDINDPNEKKALCSSIFWVEDLHNNLAFCERIVNNSEFMKPEWNSRQIWDLTGKLGSLAQHMTLKEHMKICKLFSENELRKDGLFYNFMVTVISCDAELIQNIVKVSGSHILNIGGQDGMTSLHFALKGDLLLPHIDTVKKIKILLDAGANVNIANDSFTTPLACAAEVEADISVLQLLILSGGKVYKPLSVKAQQRVDDAAKTIFDRAVELLSFIGDEKSNFNVLPKELKDIIFANSLSPFPLNRIKITSKNSTLI